MGAATTTHRLHHHRSLADEAGSSAAGEISTAIVGLLREHTGRGPTKAKTVVRHDLAVVTLDDCLTQAERTLAAAGRDLLVTEVRNALYDAIRAEAEVAVAALTGRPVFAYLASQSRVGDHAVLAFVLAKGGPMATPADDANGEVV